jgi:hypothetical protein
MPDTIRAFSWAGMFLCRSQLNIYNCSTRIKSQIHVYRRKHLLHFDESIFGLGTGLARWPDFSRPALRSSRGLRNSPSFGRLRHARQPARKMPETLEERFGRAKSGLMLAPAKTQAFAFF